MHDLDRTQLEIGDSLEAGFDTGESDLEETFEFDTEFDTETVLDEAMEMELAAELLAVSGDHELDQFLGKFLKSASRNVGRFLRSPAGRALGGMLKGVAKQLIPMAAKAAGSYFGGPAGGAVGGQLGSMGASMIKEAELEGVPSDEREFDVARKFIQMGANAAQRLASMPPNGNPVATAKQALFDAARKVTPILSGTATPRFGSSMSKAKSGRWVRAGRNIIVLRT